MARGNLGVVLRQVLEGRAGSRAAIARETGLDKSTVSRLVAELIELELVVESGAARHGGTGRPGMTLQIARRTIVAIGLEVKVGSLGVEVRDLAGGALYRAIDPSDNRARPVAELLDRVAQLAAGALRESESRGLRPIGATIAVPGLVNVERTAVLAAPNLGWADVDAAGAMRERMPAGAPAFDVDNEANLAALAELWQGVGKGVGDFVYVSGGVGIGGAIVIGGELFRGFHGFVGELGHFTVERDGRQCACGSRGCLETRAGLATLLDAAGLAAGSGPEEAIAALAARARTFDRAALGALRDCGRWLGIALGTVVNLLSPRAIVLGGYFVPILAWLAPAITRELHLRVLGGARAVPPLLPSSLGPEAAMRGAAALQLRRVLADPTLARTARHDG